MKSARLFETEFIISLVNYSFGNLPYFYKFSKSTHYAYFLKYPFLNYLNDF